MIKKQLIVIFFTTAFIAGCATIKIPQATGGSRADGIVEMSYSYDPFEIPEVQWDQALRDATERCKDWGYQQAKHFNGSRKECESYYNGNCTSTLVTIKYQCLK